VSSLREQQLSTVRLSKDRPAKRKPAGVNRHPSPLIVRLSPIASCPAFLTAPKSKIQFNGVGGLRTHIGFTRITIGFLEGRWCTMREKFSSYCFLAVTVASLVLLCSGLVAIAFT
jgi:hypothetical protein